MRITHPAPQPGRQHALGVDFRDGVATVDSLHPERELALRQHGYTIEADLDVEAPFHAALGEPIIDLTALTISQLRDIAETEGIDLPAKARKPEIIEILSYTSQPILGEAKNADGSWTVEGELVPEGTELVGPFATFERTDGSVIGDGTSLVTLDAAHEASDFEE